MLGGRPVVPLLVLGFVALLVAVGAVILFESPFVAVGAAVVVLAVLVAGLRLNE